MISKKHLYLFLSFFYLFQLSADEERGQASWYGGHFQGRPTASGEIFDTHKFTAAHKSLPFGTLVQVKNLANGKTTTVRINDRGPFVTGRIIDLSYAAAKEIDMIQSGVAQVIIYWGVEEVTEISYTIQVAAFSEIENALRLKTELEQRGYTPRSDVDNRGVIRLFLDDIPESRSFSTVEMLEELGLPDVMVRQN